MVRLPSPNDISLVTPQARGANSVQSIQAQETQPNLTPGRVLGDLGEMVYKESQKIDSLKAEEALNEIRQARLDLTMGDQGAYSVKGGGVVDPTYASGYKARIGTSVEGIMSRLTPAQQARLKPHADREIMGFQTDVLRHSMAETERYKVLVRKGTISTKVNTGISRADDAIAFAGDVADLTDSIAGMAREQGITGDSPEGKAVLDTMTREALSPMYVGGVTKMLDTKTPEGLKRAEDLFNQGGLSIEPGARLQLSEHLTKAREALTVQEKASGIVGRIVVENSDIARMKRSASEVLRTVESNGRDLNPDGTLMRGPEILDGMHKGDSAVGEYQIMPKVAPQDAKEANLPWDEKLFYDTSKEGREYREKLHLAHVARIEKVVNTPKEFFAAYIGGENGVVAARKKYEKYAASGLEQLGVPPAIVLPDGSPYVLDKNRPVDFIDFMGPKANVVRDYVRKAAKAQAALPDVIVPGAAELQATVAKEFPGRPDLALAAKVLVEKQVKVEEEQAKKRIDDATAEAFKYIDKGLSFQDIPQSTLGKLPARVVAEVEAAYIKLQSGTVRDSNTDLLFKINTEPQYLTTMTSGEWAKLRPQLAEHTWQRLDKQRTAMRDGDTTSAQSLNSGAAHSALAGQMALLGYDPTPKESDKVGKLRLNTARALLDQMVLEEQARKGRQLTDVEVRVLLADKIKTREDVKHWFGADTTVPSIMASADEIPAEDYKRIETELTARTGTKPTKEQVTLQYKQLRYKPQKRVL